MSMNLQDLLNQLVEEKAAGIKAKKAANEELVGNQKKLDANKNGKLDAQDFKKLRATKPTKESYTLEGGNAENKKKKNDVLQKRGSSSDIKQNRQDARLSEPPTYINAKTPEERHSMSDANDKKVEPALKKSDRLANRHASSPEEKKSLKNRADALANAVSRTDNETRIKKPKLPESYTIKEWIKMVDEGEMPAAMKAKMKTAPKAASATPDKGVMWQAKYTKNTKFKEPGKDLVDADRISTIRKEQSDAVATYKAEKAKRLNKGDKLPLAKGDPGYAKAMKDAAEEMKTKKTPSSWSKKPKDINELSGDTLANYAQKSADKAGKLSTDANKGTVDKSAAHAKIDKIRTGIRTASNKPTKYGQTSQTDKINAAGDRARDAGLSIKEGDSTAKTSTTPKKVESPSERRNRKWSSLTKKYLSSRDPEKMKSIRAKLDNFDTDNPKE